MSKHSTRVRHIKEALLGDEHTHTFIFTDRRASFLEDGGGGSGIWFKEFAFLPSCLHVPPEWGGEPHKLCMCGVWMNRGTGKLEEEQHQDHTLSCATGYRQVHVTHTFKWAMFTIDNSSFSVEQNELFTMHTVHIPVKVFSCSWSNSSNKFHICIVHLFKHRGKRFIEKALLQQWCGNEVLGPHHCGVAGRSSWHLWSQWVSQKRYSAPNKESTFSEILISAVKSTFSHSNHHKSIKELHWIKFVLPHI